MPLWKLSLHIAGTSWALRLLRQSEAKSRSINQRLWTQYEITLIFLSKKYLGSSPTLWILHRLLFGVAERCPLCLKEWANPYIPVHYAQGTVVSGCWGKMGPLGETDSHPLQPLRNSQDPRWPKPCLHDSCLLSKDVLHREGTPVRARSS